MFEDEKKKREYNFRRKELYTVIIFMIGPYTKVDRQTAKYHNIPCDNEVKFEAFKKFVRSTFRRARYMNIYSSVTKLFVRREYL
jgi:hypothetical protein